MPSLSHTQVENIGYLGLDFFYWKMLITKRNERNLPVNVRIGDDEEGEAPLPVERSLVLERVRLVLGLVQPLGHHLIIKLIKN